MNSFVKKDQVSEYIKTLSIPINTDSLKGNSLLLQVDIFKDGKQIFYIKTNLLGQVRSEMMLDLDNQGFYKLFEAMEEIKKNLIENGVTPVIPLSKCKHGYIYKIRARNFSFGVFRKTDNSFIGIREKFDERYLFPEYHWDTGAPFGTVHPYQELSFYSNDITETDEVLFEKLTDLERKNACSVS